MLPLRDGGLPGRFAPGGDKALHGRHVVGCGWPLGRQQQGLDLAVGFIDRQGAAEVVEVAVQVHVFVRGTADMRETIGIERMDVEHSHALRARLITPGVVVQGKHLHTAAAIALDPMAGAADDQQLVGVGGAVTHNVHGQVFPVAPLERVDVRLDRQPGQGRSFQELGARASIAGGKSLCDADHAASLGWFSHSCARRTQ